MRLSMPIRTLRFSNSTRSTGLSLIELVGVLAILAILAAMIVPSWVKNADQKAAQRETDLLDRIANGFKGFVSRTRELPAHTNSLGEKWEEWVGTEIGLPAREVKTNALGCPRVLLIDPAIRVGDPAGIDFTVPFSQGCHGSTTPSNVRFLWVSSLDINRSLPIEDGFAASSNAFDQIWDTPPESVPPGWPPVWTGAGHNLKIKRLNLIESFNRTILANLGTNNVRYFVDTNSAVLVTNVNFNIVDTYFLSGSVLGLCPEASPTAQPDINQVIQSPVSLTFQNDSWTGNPNLVASGPNNYALIPMVIGFLSLDSRNEPSFVNAMTTYMSNYVTWATIAMADDWNKGHNYNESSPNWNNPLYQVLLSNWVYLASQAAILSAPR
ncbi:MAG: hypothetical protein M1608_10525 [Candidatus Omnitrophica bacterium]|nr:hypothetical protein [Candidatus Omnitrophota bacterium]